MQVDFNVAVISFVGPDVRSGALSPGRSLTCCRFGAGFFNGFGGKVEAGETIEEGAYREVRRRRKTTASVGHLAQVLSTCGADAVCTNPAC